MKTKAIKDYKIDDVLVKYDAVKNISNEYSKWYELENQRSTYKELTITLGVDFLVNVFALIPTLKDMNNFSKTISVIILLVVLIYSIVCATKWFDAHKETKGHVSENLDDMFLKKAKENIRYTAILRIVCIEKEQILYLTGNDYFLPHCHLNENRDIYQQNKNIMQSLQKDFNIREKDIVKIIPIDETIHYSIKPIHETVQMNAFVFYDVKLKEQSKDKFITETDKRKWVSIDQMKDTPSAMSTNRDVIEMLESFSIPNDSFVNVLGEIKIIWNITSKCTYNCAICATHDENRTELNASDKLKVLNNICTAKQRIKNLDFAGGDPLHMEENTTIIQSAIKQLGSEKISITTTGEGITRADKEQFSEIMKHCEITVDASHAYLQSEAFESKEGDISRNEKNYTKSNMDNINMICEHAESLTINIPIINDDLDDKEIKVLIGKISWIKNHAKGVDLSVSLIRLMPVGKVPNIIDQNKYKLYNPIIVANKIKKELEQIGVKCTYHCSLRILPKLTSGEEDYHCNMLENKIGIDCAGNVYACAWGGYVKTNNQPAKNPFYLGNLTKVPLIKILTGESRTNAYRNIFSEIDNKNPRKYCSVVSYYMSKDLFSDEDPLAK